MKKILIIPLLAMVLFLFNNDDTASAQLLIGDGQPTLESSFGDKKNTTLSRAEIQRMLDELGAKYDVGEPFSDHGYYLFTNENRLPLFIGSARFI